MQKVDSKFHFFRQVLLASKPKDIVRIKLLDVGCRGCELKSHVDLVADYEGADLFQNTAGTVKYVADLEAGIPVADKSYDYSVALDVVEHLEDPVKGLDELMRVARIGTFVMIPNMAHMMPRLRYLFTGRFSEKYDFDFPPRRDRHRWLTVQPQSDRFFMDYAKSRNLSLKTHWYLDGPRKSRAAQTLRILGFRPSLWVWASLYVISCDPAA